MGQSFDASITYGVVFPEDYLYDNEEKLLEGTDFEEPMEALEDKVDTLCKGTNLGLKTVGYWLEEEMTRTLFCLKEPQVETGYSDDYYCKQFDPRKLDVGVATAHPEAMRIADVLGLDWAMSGWYLGWSVS